MLATLIPNHVEQALARLMEQYKGEPNIEAILTALIDQIQDLEDAIFSLDEGRQLYNGSTYPAVGAQLDGIGALVGALRNGLTDEEYLFLILGTIAKNTSDTTISAVQNVIQFLFQPEGFHLYEVFPAAVGFDFSNTPVDPSFFNLLIGIIQASLGAGISLDYVVQYSAANPFAFVDLFGILPDFPNGNGFDDLLVPGQGGLFAELIYSNPDS